MLAFTLFLALPLATWGRRVVVLLFHAGLQDSPIALLIVSDLYGVYHRLLLCFGRVDNLLDRQQQLLHSLTREAREARSTQDY